jgi:hypothetical protein
MTYLMNANAVLAAPSNSAKTMTVAHPPQPIAVSVLPHWGQFGDRFFPRGYQL